MGNSNSTLTGSRASIESVRARKHCDVFVKGMNAALEGRYTESELCFHQIIVNHPTFVEHTQLLVMLDRNIRTTSRVTKLLGRSSITNTETPQDILAAFRPPPQVMRAWEDNSPSEMPVGVPEGSPVTMTEGVNNSSVATNGESPTELAIPTGKHLATMLELLQMQQDIEHIYIACNTAKAERLAMLYAELNCLWMQLSLFLIAKVREGCEGQRKSSITTKTKKKNASAADGETNDDGLFDVYLDLMEQTMRHFFVSSSVNYGTLAFNHALRLESEEDSPDATTANTSQPVENDRKARVKRMRLQQRIFNNLKELCQAVVDTVWETADRYPDEYVSRVLFKVLPHRTVPNDFALVGSPLYGLQGSAQNRQFPDLKGRSRGGWVYPTGPASPLDYISDQSPYETSGSASTQSQGELIISRMAKLFVAYSQGKGGGTFLVESRTINPVSPVVLSLSDAKLTLRIVMAGDQQITKADLARLENPHQRVTWESTAWTLPPDTTFSGHGYPMTSDFLLTNALPQFYASVQRGANASSAGMSARYAQWRGKSASESYRQSTEEMDAYIQSLIDYARNADPTTIGNAEFAERLQKEARHGITVNHHMDMHNPRMRRAACMDETATSLELLYILFSKVLKQCGLLEDSKSCAIAATLQSVCMRGPVSPDRLRMHWMLKELELL